MKAKAPRPSEPTAEPRPVPAPPPLDLRALLTAIIYAGLVSRRDYTEHGLVDHALKTAEEIVHRCRG